MGRSDPPNTEWELKLNWSSREFGRWTAPIRSRAAKRIDRNSHTVLRPLIKENIDLLVYHDIDADTLESLTKFSLSSCRQELSLEKLSKSERLTVPPGLEPFEQYFGHDWAPVTTSLLASSNADSIELFRNEVEKFKILPCHQYRDWKLAGLTRSTMAVARSMPLEKQIQCGLTWDRWPKADVGRSY